VTTTTGLLGRSFVCRVAAPYLGLISAFARQQGKSACRRQGVVNRCHPLLPVFRPKDAFGSPKFPANPLCLCHALRPRPGLHARLLRRVGVALARQNVEGPRNYMSFEAQSHSSDTGCLRFVPPSRTTTQNSLPVVSQPCRVGFSMPTEFEWRVSAALPLSQGFAWRDLPPIFLSKVFIPLPPFLCPYSGGGLGRVCLQPLFQCQPSHGVKALLFMRRRLEVEVSGWRQWSRVLNLSVVEWAGSHALRRLAEAFSVWWPELRL